MAQFDLTKRVLRFLKPNGVGLYADISKIIRSGFPLQDSDTSDEAYNHRIREYLDNLERSRYIKCKNVVITRNTIHIEAAILDAGIKYIRPKEKGNLYKIAELLFWLAGIGVLVFMIYEHYYPKK